MRLFKDFHADKVITTIKEGAGKDFNHYTRKDMGKMVTSAEQSPKLVRMGVPADTAEFVYVGLEEMLGKHVRLFFNEERVRRKYEQFEFTPAWSLSSLIDMLPESLMTSSGDEELDELGGGNSYALVMGKDFVRYEDYSHEKLHSIYGNDLVDAVVGMLEWLYFEGWIK